MPEAERQAAAWLSPRRFNWAVYGGGAAKAVMSPLAIADNGLVVARVLTGWVRADRGTG